MIWKISTTTMQKLSYQEELNKNENDKILKSCRFLFCVNIGADMFCEISTSLI